MDANDHIALRKAWAAANDDFSQSPTEELYKPCQNKTFFIAIADRPVDNTLGLLFHYSLELWASDVDVSLYVESSIHDFQSRHAGSSRLESVELLREGGWSAYRRDFVFPGGYRWQIHNVGISVIHRSSRSTRIMPIYKGSRARVHERWAMALRLARQYRFAEQAGFDGNFKNWPNSIYIISTTATNSNTFIRHLVNSLGLDMRGLSGSHPGSDTPSPPSQEYSPTPTPWRQGTPPPPPPS